MSQAKKIWEFLTSQQKKIKIFLDTSFDKGDYLITNLFYIGS